MDVIEKTITEKQQDLNCNKITIENKDKEISELSKTRNEKQQAM